MQISWLDWIGYAASAIILISFLTSSIVRLRLINLVGCGVFAAYGFLIHSIPTGVMNLMIACINIYFLVKLFRKKEHYTILPTQKDDPYGKYFLAFYRRDIEKYYPDFHFEADSNQITFYVLRDMNPAGMVVAQYLENNTLLILLDYVIPTYRDMKVGKYLYANIRQFTKPQEISSIVTYAKDKANIKYFKAMGFAVSLENDGALIKKFV